MPPHLVFGVHDVEQMSHHTLKQLLPEYVGKGVKRGAEGVEEELEGWRRRWRGEGVAGREEEGKRRGGVEEGRRRRWRGRGWQEGRKRGGEGRGGGGEEGGEDGGRGLEEGKRRDGGVEEGGT